MNEQPLIDLIEYLTKHPCQDECGCTSCFRHVSIPFTVDGVRGTLALFWDGEHYLLRFLCHSLHGLHLGTVVVKNIDNIASDIRKISGMRHFSKEFIASEDFESRILLRHAVYSVCGMEIEQCYVCFGDTLGYKTKCNHDLCFSCFVKSCKNDRFTCGICRVVEGGWEKEYDDDGDDEDDGE